MIATSTLKRRLVRHCLWCCSCECITLVLYVELEKHRQQVVRRIRDNNQTESILNDLDIKIALLVKNRISLEEVIKASKRHRLIEEAVRGGSSSTFLSSGHSLQALDKDSRHRLECYQQLFYLLQTQPIYLARLLTALNKGPLSEKEKKFIETVVLTLFNFAQNSREEYLLLKLFKV